MNTNDILKVRSALASQLALALLGKPDSRELARETIAAFERLVDRLVSEPVDAPPQMPLRAYIATQVAASLVSCNQRKTGEVADEAVRVADALIERLKRP